MSVVGWVYLAFLIVLAMVAVRDSVLLGRYLHGRRPFTAELGSAVGIVLRRAWLPAALLSALYFDWLGPVTRRIPLPVAALAAGLVTAVLLAARHRRLIDGHSLFHALLTTAALSTYTIARPLGPWWIGRAIGQVYALALLASIPFMWRWYGSPEHRANRVNR